jgi:predicted RNA-binding Zn-ribbon protein involved in translation (DUF1610 family)
LTGLKIRDGTPTAISKYIREREEKELKCPSCTNVNHEISNMFASREMSIREHDNFYECKICGHTWRKK